MFPSKWLKAFFVFGGLLQLLGAAGLAHASDHLCVSRSDGKVYCADGNGIYTASPTWTQRSTLGNMNVQRLWAIDRNGMYGYGTYGYGTPAAEGSRFQWTSLTGAVKASSVGGTPDLTVVTSPAADGSKAYLCFVQEGASTVAGSNVIRCMDDADTGNTTVVDLPKPGGMPVQRIAVKYPAIWALTKDGGIWYKRSMTSSANDWIQMPGWATEIAVDPVSGNLCVIGSGQGIYCASNPIAADPGWYQIPGWATAVTLYNGKIWVVGGNNDLYYKSDISASGNWVHMNGKGASIVAGGDLSLPALCRSSN